MIDWTISFWFELKRSLLNQEFEDIRPITTLLPKANQKSAYRRRMYQNQEIPPPNPNIYRKMAAAMTPPATIISALRAAAPPVLTLEGRVTLLPLLDDEAFAAAEVVLLVPLDPPRAWEQIVSAALVALAWSSALQFFNTHGVTAAVTLSLPVVHWQTMSSTAHPAAAAPLVKQVKAHAGITLKSTVTATAADENKRAKTAENLILTTV